MPGLKIILEGEGSLQGLREHIVEGVVTHVIALGDGMASGKPSVGIVIQMPDGRAVFGQTSMVLFLSAADAFRARHGDPRKDEEAKAKA